MSELTVENSLATAVNVFCRLESAGVTYQRVEEWERSLLKTRQREHKIFTIEAQPEVTVSNNPYPGWKPPGNYHHRRGRR